MAKTTLRLSDAQQAIITRAAWALSPSERELLRQRVLGELEAAPEIGDGLVHRVCRSVQRSLFVPPDDHASRHQPRVLAKKF